MRRKAIVRNDVTMTGRQNMKSKLGKAKEYLVKEEQE